MLRFKFQLRREGMSSFKIQIQGTQIFLKILFVNESFNLNKSNLDAKLYSDNNHVYRLDNHVYRLDFLDNENGGINFTFDNFMPNKPELDKNINAKYMIHVLVNHNLLCFSNLIIIVVMDAYVYHKFCKSRSC